MASERLYYVLSVPAWAGQLEKARKYNMMMLTNGTAIKRLNHPECPAFVKMDQNGMIISAANINIMNGPGAPHICIGMSRIVSHLKTPFHILSQVSTKAGQLVPHPALATPCDPGASTLSMLTSLPRRDTSWLTARLVSMCKAISQEISRARDSFTF